MDIIFLNLFKLFLQYFFKMGVICKGKMFLNILKVLYQKHHDNNKMLKNIKSGKTQVPFRINIHISVIKKMEQMENR